MDIFKIGELLTNFRQMGSYSASTTYKKYDIVTYSNIKYMSLKDSNRNHKPNTSTSWWESLESIMQPIGKVSFRVQGDYNTNTTYSKLDIVKYNNLRYISRIDENNNTPTGATDSNWQLLASDSTYTPTVIDGILQ